MILGKFSLNDSISMDFILEIYGSTDQPSKIRFNIEGTDYDIGCRCEQTSEGVRVHIPKLRGIIQPGVYEATLSVELDGKIFSPLKESIEFEKLIEVDAKKRKVETVKEGVKVTAKNIKVVSEDTRETGSTGIEKNIQKAIREGFEVSKIGSNYVMKKADKYVGLISEQTILKSDVQYSTLTELIDGLSS
jgi:hypothetical protein